MLLLILDGCFCYFDILFSFWSVSSQRLQIESTRMQKTRTKDYVYEDENWEEEELEDSSEEDEPSSKKKYTIHIFVY